MMSEDPRPSHASDATIPAPPLSTKPSRARELADLEGVPNVRFDVGDVEVHPLRPAEIDVAVSRFGTMFFAHPDVAFRNVANAMRAGGRLVMMVW